MKWLGQHIWDLISRFRSDVYLDSPTAGGSDPDKFLGIDSNGKVIYRTGTQVLSDIGGSSSTGDIDRVSLTTDDTNMARVTSGNADLNLTGGACIDTTADGSVTATIAVDLNELSTSTTSSDIGEGFFAIISGEGTQHKMAPGTVPISTLNNDSGYAAGDITAVVAGTNLSGGATTGSATINLANASASAKGAVELATPAECTTGTDTDRAVTPEGLAEAKYKESYHYIHTENKFTATTANEYYFSLTDVERDVAAGSENGVGIVAIMPATGILKTAIIHSGSNLSAKTWEWKLKKVPSGTVSTSPTLIATVAASAGPAGNTNKNISFVTDPGDGTNTISYESGFNATTMFSAGDRVLFSQESNTDVSGSPKIQLTLIFKLDETTAL